MRALRDYTSSYTSYNISVLSYTDVNLLDNIVQNFGMLDLVKKVLARHKSQMDHYREQYTQSLAGEGSD